MSGFGRELDRRLEQQECVGDRASCGSEGERAAVAPADWHAWYADVFRRAPYPLAIVRTADAFIYDVNDAFERATGYARDQMVGRLSHDVGWWPSAEVEERVLGRLRELGYLPETEFPVLDKQGNPHVILACANAITMHGEPCVVWQSVDITEGRRAQEAQRELEERLRKKQNLERLGSVAGAIAHDFNNLLVSVLGNADLALQRVDPGSSLYPALSAIVTSAQRAADHTRELLDYAGRGGGKLKPLRLDRVLADAIDSVRPHVHEPIALGCRIEVELWVEGDAGQLTRLWANLIRNALDACRGETQRVVVHVALERSGDRAVVTICDSGRGLDETARAHLFDPFLSSRGERSGLGLASVPSIVERHAGEIQVESAPGMGSSVRVSLPTCPEPEPVRAAPPLAPQSTHARVLLVDDEPHVRAAAALMLAHFGFAVTEAESGSRALELCRQATEEFAFVLLDATMPGLDGAQTLEALRAMRPGLPVLLCSGYSRTDFTRVLAEQPRVSFLTKPYRAEELQAAIAALLADGPAAG